MESGEWLIPVHIPKLRKTKILLFLICCLYILRCPTRKQNKDYALYLLTVLYHEAWVSPGRVKLSLISRCFQSILQLHVIVRDKLPQDYCIWNAKYFSYIHKHLFIFQKTEPWETDSQQDEEEEEIELPKKKRQSPIRLRLVGDEIYRFNKYGKGFKLQIKTKV